MRVARDRTWTVWFTNSGNSSCSRNIGRETEDMAPVTPLDLQHDWCPADVKTLLLFTVFDRSRFSALTTVATGIAIHSFITNKLRPKTKEDTQRG